MMTLQNLAKALGGEINSGQVLAPGPGHSAADRSLSIKLDKDAPDGFIVHSFSGDNPIACKDYVREKVRLEPFKPNGGNGRRNFMSNDAIERAVLAVALGGSTENNKPKGRIVATYAYV